MALDSGSSSAGGCDVCAVVSRVSATPVAVVSARAIESEEMALWHVAAVLVLVVDYVYRGSA